MKRLWLGMFLCILVGVLLGCSSGDSKDVKTVKASSTAKGTVLMFKNLEENYGDLYISIMGQEEEKVASNVSVYDTYYDASTESVFFIDSEANLYKFNRGKDKEKLASNVSSLSTDYGNLFYYSTDSELYVVLDNYETEKIGTDIYYFDLIGKNLYYINNDSDFKLYNISSKTESLIASDVQNFKMLSSEGSLIYTNQDEITYYKEGTKDAVKLISESLNYGDLIATKNEIYYTIYEDDLTLYQTTLSSNSQTTKLAGSINSFNVHNNQVYYVTTDFNLFSKSVKESDAQKIASDVWNFDISEDVLYYRNEDAVYQLKLKGSSEKIKIAQSDIRYQLSNDGQFIYSTEEGSLYVDDVKMTGDLNGFQIYDDNLVYSTNDDKLYRSTNFGAAAVVDEDISEYTYIYYNNALVYSNELSLSDFTGYWEYTDYYDVVHFEISGNQIVRNLTANEEYKVEMTYSDLYSIELELEYYGESKYVTISKRDNDSMIWDHWDGNSYDFVRVTKEQATSYY